MDDDKFDATFGPTLRCHNEHSTKWTSLMAALSLWGQKVTGLPIDFQVQRNGRVRKEDWDKPRIPIGMKALQIVCARCDPERKTA
jgi:hypothetical protein